MKNVKIVKSLTHQDVLIYESVKNLKTDRVVREGIITHKFIPYKLVRNYKA